MQAAALLLATLASASAQFVGVDANYAPEMMAVGKGWTRGGQMIDPYKALAESGAKVARIRLWVGEEGPSKLAYATDVARRAQAAGLQPYLVLFLSEEWADYVKQPAPVAWRELGDEAKAAAVEAYAEKVTRHFLEQGIAVELFEIGNEIDFGICGIFEEDWAKRVSLAYMRDAIWPRMAAIIKAAQRGVLKAQPKAKFVLHLTQWENVAYCVAFWRHMLEAGVQLDVAGLSYFPSSMKELVKRTLTYLPPLVAAIETSIARPVLLCETGYPNSAEFGGQFADWNKPSEGYPLTPDGQARWVADLTALVRRDTHFAGVVFWSPEWYGGGIWDAFAWFDERGVARPVLGSFVETHLAPAPPLAARLHVYLGNLHAHTAASDGTGDAAEAYAFARETAGLDFLALTEHNHLLGGDAASAEARANVYQAVITGAVTTPGKFVALYGQEFSSMSKGNHVNAFDVPAVIDAPNGAFNEFVGWLEAHPDSAGQTAVVQFNHPALGYSAYKGARFEYGRDDFGDDAGWRKAMGGVTSLVELLNGEPTATTAPGRAPQIMDGHYGRLLRLGFHLAPTGNQDNHKKAWGTATEVRTGLIAPELTKPALLAAMRARHAYASEDKNWRALVMVNDSLCGDFLPQPGPMRVAVQVADANEPEAKYTLEALRGRVGAEEDEVVLRANFAGDTPAGQAQVVEGLSLTRADEFIYFRLTQSSARGVDRLWTAPVWLAPAGSAPKTEGK